LTARFTPGASGGARDARRPRHGRHQLRNPHGARTFLAAAERQYGGTRFGRQELLGELLEDLEGSLWPRGLIETSQTSPLPREAYSRVVIGVDPPVTAHGDECGIVACGLTRRPGQRRSRDRRS
jgi:phage terminase large subunit-like protein